MKIFISYAIGRREDYLITMLTSNLRREGFFIASLTEPSEHPTTTLTYESQTAIASSDMLIAIVTKSGGNPVRITKEWDFAIASNIPYGILAEEGVAIEEKYLTNTFYFKRNDLTEVEKIIEDRQSLFELVHHPSANTPKINRAQRITWFALYDVLLTILPVFTERELSVS